MYDPSTSILRHLDLSRVDAPDDVDVAMSMPLTPSVVNVRGAMLGGLVAQLCDMAAGVAAGAAAGPGATVPTSDLTIHYLSPVSVGPALAHARIVRAGRARIVAQVEVFDEGRDVLAAVATLAFTVLEARPGQHRQGSILT